jgi:hypothetical protein
MRAKLTSAIALSGSILVLAGAAAAAPATGATNASAGRAEKAVRAAVRDAVQKRIVAAAQGLGPAGGSPAAGRGTRLTGSLHIPGGLNADVYAYHGFAYVGTWSGPCPGTGVKIIDVGDPAHPHQVATAAGYSNTSAEDMQVVSVQRNALE